MRKSITASIRPSGSRPEHKPGLYWRAQGIGARQPLTPLLQKTAHNPIRYSSAGMMLPSSKEVSSNTKVTPSAIFIINTRVF